MSLATSEIIWLLWLLKDFGISLLASSLWEILVLLDLHPIQYFMNTRSVLKLTVTSFEMLFSSELLLYTMSPTQLHLADLLQKH